MEIMVLEKPLFFRVLLAEMESAGGYLRYGVNVSIGYYDQAQVNLDPDKTIIEAVVERVEDLTVTAIRTAPGAFLFAEMIYKRKFPLYLAEKKHGLRFVL